ncbi:Golgi-associated plant pathogenesis-related protein 1 [Chionoecetes opilio]|uniref:Golgi-associated plant pathogenesis-related protein 1 n=1 Tax=Chionoecetes opilio TaxID=41210 RepID=A0A8J4YUV5_CHIOP|nr:Golgi-associated plant pathogenesis-related protein 1 [Chionoecetes opilio]
MAKYGENVFCLSSNTTNFDVKPNEVVDHWYSENKDHKFGEEPKGTTLKSGHFSQMVWKDSKQMGVSKARSAAGTKVFVVANFDPQGNWMGQFADQVPPVGGFPKTASSAKPSIFSKARKSSSSSESDSSSDEEDFADSCLKAHNDYRKKHGAPALKLSKKLSKVAKEWADTIAKKDVLQHRPNNQHGENLYCYYSPDPKFRMKGDEAVKSWYSEIKDYKFGVEPRDLRAGHFTQVVWSDSKELGVATAKSRSGKTYVVANYNPAGNFVGSFGSKVPKMK